VNRRIYTLLTVCLALAVPGYKVYSGEAETASMDPGNGGDHALAIFRKRMGLFIHWCSPGADCRSGIRFSNGKLAGTADEFAAAVNVPKVCDEIAALGFEYVVLTDFHGHGTMLHPSKASDKWRGAGFASRRDVVGEMIAALKARRISMILFTHPLCGNGFSAEQKKRVGWNDPTGNYRRWNDFINDVYAELTGRYGKDVICMGFDSEFSRATRNGKENWTGSDCAGRSSRSNLT